MQFSTWMHSKPDDFYWKTELEKLATIGIKRIFYEGENLEPLLLAAQAIPLEIHKWQWIVNRPDQKLYQTNPDFFMVNKVGQSCAEFPPYVGYYRWLCPNNPAALQEILKAVKLYKDEKALSGLHLDYIRFPDIFLPIGLQPQYNLKQNVEMPQFDYCYCQHCLQKFRLATGLDARNLKSSRENQAWIRFRLNTISNLVIRIKSELKETSLTLTAAVFPSPSVAAKAVRQDWSDWPLDAAFSMLYHKFYLQDVNWIADMVEKSRLESNNKFPIHAGIYLPEINPKELSRIIDLAKLNDFAGISFFPAAQLNDEIKEIINNAN